jgi:hypothetical protein
LQDGRCRTAGQEGENGAYAYAYATADTAKRDPSELPLKQADHALDATRYALHGELTGWVRTEAYLADMRRRMGKTKRRLHNTGMFGGAPPRSQARCQGRLPLLRSDLTRA